MSQRMLRGMAAGLGALVSLGSMAGCGTDGQVQKANKLKTASPYTISMTHLYRR